MYLEDRYPDGLDMEQFFRLSEVSHYNYNYYQGFDSDLLFGLSDDDRTTEWWIIKSQRFIYLGESYVENEKLNRYEKRCT